MERTHKADDCTHLKVPVTARCHGPGTNSPRRRPQACRSDSASRRGSAFRSIFAEGHSSRERHLLLERSFNPADLSPPSPGSSSHPQGPQQSAGRIMFFCEILRGSRLRFCPVTRLRRGLPESPSCTPVVSFRRDVDGRSGSTYSRWTWLAPSFTQ